MPRVENLRKWLIVIWAAAGILLALCIEFIAQHVQGNFIWPREKPSVVFTLATFGLAFLSSAIARKYRPRASAVISVVVVFMTLAALCTHLYYWHRWTLFVVERDKPRETGVRTVIGQYRDDIRDERERLRRANLPVPTDEDFLEKETWQVEAVFDSQSIALNAAVLHLSWLVMGGGFMWLAAWGIHEGFRFFVDDPDIARLREQLLVVVAKLPPHAQRELNSALETLERHGNPSDVATAIGRALEGHEGLLTNVAAHYAVQIAAALGTLNNEDGKRYRKKYQNGSFGALDLLDQIEILRLTGVLESTLASDLHWVRTYRNKGAHVGGVPRDDALTAFRHGMKAARWYADQITSDVGRLSRVDQS